jgi:hypothetical protein
MAEWIEPGQKAPAFTLTADDGKKVRLSDFAGRPVVLYFYPKDDTPGCGFAHKLLWEGSPTPITARQPQRIAVECEIGVGDASHRSVFVQSRMPRAQPPL